MRRAAAFTLVELLVALAITVIVVLLLTSVVAATLGAWSQGRNRLDTYASARQILGRIGDELKGAIANPAVSGGQIQFVENAALGSVPAPLPGTAENVFFVAPYPNLGAGNLCSIAYALDSTTHELKRAFRSSDQAWSDPPASRFQASGHTYTATDWRVIATGVLQFELQCHSQHDLDLDQPPAVTWDSESNDVQMVGKSPCLIVVRLQVVDDRSATQLASMTPGSSAYTAIVGRSSRQFSAEVSLTPP